MSKFLNNGCNKDALLKLIKQIILQEQESLCDRVVYFSWKTSCIRISKNSCDNVPQLETDHMEADTDTMLSYLITYCFEIYGKSAVVRSTSGDTDIPVILLNNMKPGMEIILDNGTGKSRQKFILYGCSLSDLDRKALVGFHAFTGNDYVSSFFRKGKRMIWEKVKSDQQAMDTFANLGIESTMSVKTFAALNRIVQAYFTAMTTLIFSMWTSMRMMTVMKNFVRVDLHYLDDANMIELFHNLIHYFLKCYFGKLYVVYNICTYALTLHYIIY